VSDLGWVTMGGDAFLGFMRRAAEGENADLLYAEFYANSDVEYVPPVDGDSS
jgi:hypothetical protein